MKRNVLVISSALFSIAAIVLSWQAYKISKVLEQFTPRISLVDQSDSIVSTYSGRDEPVHFVCAETIRLKNEGGTVTSLSNYEVIVSSGENSIQYENAPFTVIASTNSNLSPLISSFRSAIFNDELGTTFAAGNFSDAIPLPFQIAPYSAFDLYLVTDYIVDLNKEVVLPQPQISYKLHFSSGQIVDVPLVVCQ